MAQFRVPVLEKFAYQEPVLAIVNTPTSTNKGDRFIVGDTPAGDFAGFSTNDIAWMDDGSVWKTDTPVVGWQTYNINDGAFWNFNGSVWSSGAVFDGLEITGDIDSDADDIDWLLHDNRDEALTFVTATGIDMLNFKTIDGDEAVEIDVDLVLTAGVDLTAGATNVQLNDLSTSAITFSNDSTSLLTIDAVNDNVIAGSGMIINGDLTVKGATTTIETTEMVVNDPTITINNGGAAGSGVTNGVGFEFEENDAIAGYIKNSTDGFVLSSTTNEFILTLDIDATSTLQMAGNLSVETEGGSINQDLTTDSTVVEFAGLKLTGDIDLTDGARAVSLASDANALNIASGLLNIDTASNIVSTSGEMQVGTLDVDGDIDLTSGAIDIDLIDNTASAVSFDAVGLAGILAIDTTDAGEKVTMSGGLDVTGDINAAANVIFPTAAEDGTEYIQDISGASVNVAQMEQSYDSRAIYDTTLKVMRFYGPTEQA